MKSDILEAMAEAEDGVYAVDMRQRIVFWNEAAERILGHRAEDMVGRRCYEVFRGDSEEGELKCRRNCNDVLLARSGRVGASHNVRTRSKDGNLKWISFTHVLLPAAKRELGTLVHIFHDASDEVEAKRLVKQLSGLIAKGPAAAERHVPVVARAEGTLSARELEILRLLAQGTGTDSIANELVISPTTVRNHIQRILAKLGAHSRLEAVAAASR